MGNAPYGYGVYQPPASQRARPAVILWFRVYALVGAAAYALALVLWLRAFFPGLPPEDEGTKAFWLLVPVVAFHLGGVLLPFKPWAWAYGLVLICFGMLSCFFPASIALIIFWGHPQTKAAFRRM